MNLSKKNIITFLLLIILLGAFLRFYKLGENSFVADEFLDINSSYAYAKTGIWQNWDFNFGQVNTDNVLAARDERAWIYKGQVAELFKFLPPTETVARSISVLWGIFSIILIYFVGAYFTKRKEIGLLSAFLFAVSTSGIIFDRRLRMYAMFFAVFLLFSWLLFKFFEEEYKGKNKIIANLYQKTGFNVLYLLPMLVAGIASILTHQLTANIVFIFTIYAIIQFFLTRKNEKPLNKYSFSLAILVAGFIVAFVIARKTTMAYLAGLRFFNNHWGYIGKSFSDYSHILIAIILVAIGIYFLYRQEKLKKEALWLAVSFLGTLLIAILIWNRTIGDQYIFFIKSFGIILLAAGIWGLADFFQNNLPKFKKLAFYLPILLALLIVPNYAYFFQPDNVYNQTSESDNPNYEKVFAYFKKAKNEKDVLITRKFRNYYWSGAKTKVFDFGVSVSDDGSQVASNKLTLDGLKNILAENPSGWFIASDNDEVYISNDALDYIVRNLEKVSNLQVRGKIKVYRWGNTPQ